MAFRGGRRSGLAGVASMIGLGLGGAVFAQSPTGAGAAGPGAPPTRDWVEAYAGLLERYTEAVDAEVGTRVDYRGLRNEPAWGRMVEALGRVDPGSLPGREARLAFWIDVYNVFAIDLVLRNYPVESIKDIGSFFRPVWGRRAGTIRGRDYSLDEIEHDILRPMGEPRIHGAIVCASISCPNLRREPYRADRLDEQLDDNMRAWLARPEKGLALDRAAGEIRVSRIFDWFEDDFEPMGGVRAVVTRYAPPDDRAWLRANAADADLEYFDYDWGLNE